MLKSKEQEAKKQHNITTPIKTGEINVPTVEGGGNNAAGAQDSPAIEDGEVIIISASTDTGSEMFIAGTYFR